MLYFQTFSSICYIRIYRSPCYISNCPYFSIPYIYTHHSDQFRTLLLAPYYHNKFQLIFVSSSFSASLVTYYRALFLYSYFSFSILYGHFLFMVILTSYIPFYKCLQKSWSLNFFITLPVRSFFLHMSILEYPSPPSLRRRPTDVLHPIPNFLHRVKYFSA